MIRVAPPPFDDPMVEENRLMSSEFFNWLQTVLLPAVEQSPSIFGGGSAVVSLSAQSAAIAPTALPLGSLNTGLYRVTTYLRITTPAGVSSSVQPVIGFTDEGVACTMTGQALTANAINLPISQSFMVDVQSPGPITYEMLYASNPANAAQYKLEITVERV